MKPLRKIIPIFLILAIIAIGCAKAPTKTINKEIESKKTEVISRPKTKNVDSLYKKLPPNASSEDVANYIKGNIENASKAEADKMMTFLILYQNMELGYFQTKAWEDWDRESTESDSSLRNRFLIMNIYDGSPTVETDWESLLKYSSFISEDLAEIFRINKKVNNFEYDREKHDVPGLSEDLIKVEEILKNTGSAYIKLEGSRLLRSLTGLLLFEEYNYIYDRAGKNTQEYKEYKAIMNLREKYPESILKEILDDIDLTEFKEDDIDEIFEIIDSKLHYRLNSNSYLEIKQIANKNGEYELLEIKMPENIERQNRINNIIKINTEEFIESLTDYKNFKLSIDQNFHNHRYISYCFNLVGTDSKGDKQKIEAYRNFDYVEEKFISLEDYFDADFTFIQKYIEELRGIQMDILPDFQLSQYGGIYLYPDLGNPEIEGVFFEHKELLKYYTLEELVGK